MLRLFRSTRSRRPSEEAWADRPTPNAIKKSANRAGLADTRLARADYQRTLAVLITCNGSFERVQLRLALEQATRDRNFATETGCDVFPWAIDVNDGLR